MDNDSTDSMALRVSAHVLVQLGSELVTDVEQAILECVKNAYDADSPGCRISIDTEYKGMLTEVGTREKLLPFHFNSENVEVTFFDPEKKVELPKSSESNTNEDDSGSDLIERRLNYTGRIIIEDHGDGLTPDQLKNSWLVISKSAKRPIQNGPKEKTKKRNRTPLGDKGLGRLGSMKLGDILLVESSPSESLVLSSAQFRWKDCETAETIDQIPVFSKSIDNEDSFKGTKVSVLGLKDLHEWRRDSKIFQITKSLAKLISPFEVTSTFPVTVSINNIEQSLVNVTNEVLARAISEFSFRWEQSNDDQYTLIAQARFKKRLFMSERSEGQRQKFERAFKPDNGQGFRDFLNIARKMKRYTFCTAEDKDTFIELEQRFDWNKLVSDNPTEMVNPGPFHGSFYFFHLDDLGNSDSSAAAAGLGINRSLIKEMSGVSILRDGFTVRSQGDWLGISGGMTSGSIYHMRVDNTIGYFALTGEKNYKLIEKSDREGFVDDTAHRGFVQIAKTCKNFANDALENIRRAFDEYYHQLGQQESNTPPKTAAGSLRQMEQAAQQTRDAKSTAEKAAATLTEEFEKLKNQAQTPSSPESTNQNNTTNQALELVEQAVKAINNVQQKLDSKKIDSSAIHQLKHELQTNKEQISALYESAAVGLSARGLSHELRTHLSEIKSRTTLIQRQIKDVANNEAGILSNLKSIRAACTGIASAAALIDPMLPRARALKENIDLKEFVSDYVSAREIAFDREQITVHQVYSPLPTKVRSNRARLLQILDNFVRNSVYWLKRGISTKETHTPKEITIKINDGIMTIWDNGPGIDRDYEDSIFDIFVTAKPVSDSGQGLGLFIVTQLLSLDGCDVTLSSERNTFGRLYKFNVNLQPIAVRG